MARTVLVLLGLFSLSLANHIDLNSYTFSASLSSEIGQGDDYQLYWNINRTGDPTTSIISFAVRVRTTGWVGLGVSPTGDMTGSDVVIGWVNEGDLFLHVRLRFRSDCMPANQYYLIHYLVFEGGSTCTCVCVTAV